MRRPLLIFLASASIAAAQAPPAKGPGTFDPKNLTGKYHRETPFQTYSNVPGGANELQAFLLKRSQKDCTMESNFGLWKSANFLPVPVVVA